MKKIYFLLCTSALLSVKASFAQMVPPNCFIKGDFVEVGISNSGAFGACNAPVGYHPNGIPGSRTLGFVSDPDQDGWLVSAPGKSAYMGDYFVPGTPYEAWDVEFGGTKYSSRNCPSGGTLGGGGTYGNVSYSASATEQRNVWSGNIGALSIRQTTVVRKSKVYFVIYVDLVNTGTTTLNNVYYQRAVDADNEQPWTGDFATINKVVYQPNAISKNCLVTAKGQVYSNSYLGLGTKDCRAKCYILSSGLFSTSQLSQLYAGTGSASSHKYNIGATLTSDVGYGLVFNLGNLAPGQRTSLAYTYILKQSDLDSALGETAPKFASDGVPYAPYTTFRVCPGKTIKLALINGGQYKWIWTAADSPHRMTAIGSSTLVPEGGTVPTVTGTMTFPNGAVYGDSVEVTVMGPKTYLATGYSNCDTQYMYFYVDTVNFPTPPSVLSPVRYCEGAAAAALTAGAATGAVLKWYDPSGIPLGAAPTPSTVLAAGGSDFDTTRYFVSQVNAGGCETPKAKIDVIVTRNPPPPEVVNLIYCQGDTTKVLDAPGLNKRWYDAIVAGTQYSAPPKPSSAVPALLSYWVSQTVNGCESDRAQLDVEISAITAGFTTAKDSLCGSESLDFLNTSASTSLPATYSSQWSFGDGAGPFISKDYTYHYPDARGTYTVTLNVENIHGCKDKFSKVIEVFEMPVITPTGNKNKICQGDAIDFKGTATPGYRGLTWDFGDSDPAYNSLDVRHAFTKAGMFTVQLQGNFPACPGTSGSVPVEVIAVPIVNLGSDTGICPGNAALKLYNITGAMVDKYMWNTGDTTPTINVSNAGEYSVQVQNWECAASDSITVSKACYLNIPNMFTPGSGSDYDNYFMPRNLMSRSVVTFSMQLFDRWGQLIFETDKVNGRGWDGNYKGNAMPMGVYVYMIRVSFANGVSESYDGNVTLLR